MITYCKKTHVFRNVIKDFIRLQIKMPAKSVIQSVPNAKIKKIIAKSVKAAITIPRIRIFAV